MVFQPLYIHMYHICTLYYLQYIYVHKLSTYVSVGGLFCDPAYFSLQLVIYPLLAQQNRTWSTDINKSE